MHMHKVNRHKNTPADIKTIRHEHSQSYMMQYRLHENTQTRIQTDTKPSRQTDTKTYRQTGKKAIKTEKHEDPRCQTDKLIRRHNNRTLHAEHCPVIRAQKHTNLRIPFAIQWRENGWVFT